MPLTSPTVPHAPLGPDDATRLRAMAPQPTPPVMLPCGLWLGLTAHKMWPAITERRVVVVVAKSADEQTMPLPDDNHDWHSPRFCGFIDLGTVERYPWDKDIDVHDHATLAARKWLTENEYQHYLERGGWDGRVIVLALVAIVVPAGTDDTVVWTLAGLLAIMYVTEAVRGWIAFGRRAGGAVYDEEDEG